MAVLSLFDAQDGKGVQFKSLRTGKYVCAESGGGSIIVANRTAASGWETFKVSSFLLVLFYNLIIRQTSTHGTKLCNLAMENQCEHV